MIHYTEDQWVDYVRGLLAASTRKECRRHLDSGCSTCGATARLFARVVSASARQREQRPPARVVGVAREYFSRRQMAGAAARSLGSQRTPRPGLAATARLGTPSVDRARRQVLYYCNDYALTLQICCIGCRRDVALGGELRHRSTGPVANVPVLLMAGHTVLGFSLSGASGDFRLFAGSGDLLQLRVLLDEGALIEIDLDWPPGWAQQHPE